MKWLPLLLFIVLSAPAADGPFACERIRVVDGDTIECDIHLALEMWLVKQKIRLYGIQAPEKKEPGWAEAKAELERLAPSINRVLIVKRDKYGDRIDGTLLTTTGENVNASLVQSGHAKEWYP